MTVHIVASFDTLLFTIPCLVIVDGLVIIILLLITGGNLFIATVEHRLNNKAIELNTQLHLVVVECNVTEVVIFVI